MLKLLTTLTENDGHQMRPEIRAGVTSMAAPFRLHGVRASRSRAEIGSRPRSFGNLCQSGRKAMISLLFVLCLMPSLGHAIVVNTVAADGVTTAQITAALQGAGVTISNLTIVNNGCANRNQAIGLFSQGTTPTGPGPVLGDASGVVLGTGPLKAANPLVSPNNVANWTNALCNANVSDPDMVLLEPQTANGEYIAIEFDIVPTQSIMSIPFQFGSDEFPEYVCTAYNDATGIFVSGPGINGPYANNAENFAKTAAGDLTSINWVNTGLVGNQGGLAQCGSLTNTAYYTDNSNGNTNGGNATVATTNTNLELDGWTNYIYQPITVVPGASYHVKAIVADAGDRQWDSAVFFHLIFSSGTMPGFDFGDAPDSYRTLTSSGGPRHAISTSLYLGASPPDNEVTGQPTVTANGDDITGSDDEDGVSSLATLSTAATSYSVDVTVTNTTGSSARLLGWIDFNRNGVFETTEGVSINVADNTSNGIVTLTWNGLAGLVGGTTYARFRLTTDAAVTTATPGGTATDGEVEDYTLAIVQPDLSTSTKNWFDTNGGDQEPGDTIRYTITLSNTGLATATGVSVTDNISTRFEVFSVFSFPAGASDGSTPGSGPLDISNITVPAGGSVTIVFDVDIMATTPPGTLIDNSATVLNPAGPGASPAAPTLTVAGGAVAASGIKPLYLHDGTTTPAYKLSRTPAAVNAANYVAIYRGPTTQVWTLSPPLTLPVTINSGTIPVRLWLASNTGRTYTIPVELYCGATRVAFLNTGTATLVGGALAAPFNFNLPLAADYTCPAGSAWELRVTNSEGGTGTARQVRVFPAPSANNYSNVPLSSQNVIDIQNSNITFHTDSYANGGGSTVTTLATGSPVYIQVAVSDPFGVYDITGATLLLTDSAGTVKIGSAPATPVAMTEVAAAGAIKTYEYGPYTIAGPGGAWTARVVATEGAEGTVSDFGLAGLMVTLPPPSITVLKSTVGGISRANSGDVLTYTILTSNGGPGFATAVKVIDNLSPYVSLILDFDGVTPPYEPFNFTPSTSGLTLGSPLYYDSGGLFTPNFAAGEDGSVVRWEMPMSGTFSAGGNFTIQFKVRIK